METAHPDSLFALMIIVAASLLVLVYVFLRIAGLIGRHGHRDVRPPPPTPMG